MAKVFSGQVFIPGDKIDEYFEAMKKAEEERAPFKAYLESLRDDFYAAIPGRPINY